jgi:hypothetical protein
MLVSIATSFKFCIQFAGSESAEVIDMNLNTVYQTEVSFLPWLTNKNRISVGQYIIHASIIHQSRSGILCFALPMYCEFVTL